MGEIQPNKCEGRELTKDQLAAEMPLSLWGEEASEVRPAFAHSVEPPKPVPGNPMGHLYGNTSAYIELMLDHKMPGTHTTHCCLSLLLSSDPSVPVD